MKKLWKNTMLEMKKYVLFLLMSPISIYLGFLCMGALIMIYEFVAGASDLGWRGLEETWSWGFVEWCYHARFFFENVHASM